MIKILTRYWRAAIRLSRAKPISWGERGFNVQYCYRDHYKLGIWVSRTEDRREILKVKVVSPKVAPAWNPDARVTMGSDMPAEARYNVRELLSEPLGPEWEASRQKIEQENKEYWSRACVLWNRPDLRHKVHAKQKGA